MTRNRCRAMVSRRANVCGQWLQAPRWARAVPSHGFMGELSKVTKGRYRQKPCLSSWNIDKQQSTNWGPYWFMTIPKTSTSITCPAAQGCREGHGRGMPLLLGHGQQKLKGHAPSLFTSRNPEQGTVDWINLWMGPDMSRPCTPGEHWWTCKLVNKWPSP